MGLFSSSLIQQRTASNDFEDDSKAELKVGSLSLLGSRRQRSTGGGGGLVQLKGKRTILVTIALCLLIALNTYSSSRRLEETKKKNVSRNRKKLWLGEEVRHTAGTIKTVYIAIAYCNWNLDWMKKDVFDQLPKNVEIQMTILSKCGNEDRLSEFEDPRIIAQDIIPLPNVGGCDYGYAYYLNDLLKNKKERIDPTSVFLFIKDTPRTSSFFQISESHERYRSISEMMRVAKSDFICGAKTLCNQSPYHDTATLGDYTILGYLRQTEKVVLNLTNADQSEFNVLGYRNLRDFHLRALNYSSPSDLVEVCYAGAFAVPGARMKELTQDTSTIQVIESLLQALSRNSSRNMIEEHFAERTWAGLLSYRLSREDTAIIRNIGTEGTFRNRDAVYGAMLADNSSWVCSNRNDQYVHQNID